MPINKQLTEDYRIIDISGGDYTSEKGRYFLVDAFTGGDIVYVSPITGLDVTITVLDGYEGKYYTETIRQAGTTASNLIAIY